MVPDVRLSPEGVPPAGLPVGGQPGVLVTQAINGHHLVIAGRLQLVCHHLGALKSEAASKLEQFINSNDSLFTSSILILTWVSLSFLEQMRTRTMTRVKQVTIRPRPAISLTC